MMRALFASSVLLIALVGACGSLSRDDCEEDPSARHHAMNPTTGECWEFYSSCNVPSDWPDCDPLEPTPDAPVTPTPDASPEEADGGVRPDAGPSTECFTTADCSTGEICPAEFGFCSFSFVPDPVPPACTSPCETACYSDFDCAVGTRCNAPDLVPACPVPHFKREAPGAGDALLACAGWCVPI